MDQDKIQNDNGQQQDQRVDGSIQANKDYFQILSPLSELDQKENSLSAITELQQQRTSIQTAVCSVSMIPPEASLSVGRVEDVAEALWGTRVSSGTVAKLNQKVYRHVERWRNQAIEGECPYMFLDGIVLKRSWAGEVRDVSVLVGMCLPPS